MKRTGEEGPLCSLYEAVDLYQDDNCMHCKEDGTCTVRFSFPYVEPMVCLFLEHNAE